MPTVQVHIKTNGFSPNFYNPQSRSYTIPFELPYKATDHTYHNIYFKSLGISITEQVLPTRVTVQLENVDHDKKHKELSFPMYQRPGIQYPSTYHFCTDMHLGTISTDSIIRGTLTFHIYDFLLLPLSTSLIFFIDSEYM